MWFLLLALAICIIGYAVVHFRHRTPTSMDSSIDTFAAKREALSQDRHKRR